MTEAVVEVSAEEKARHLGWVPQEEFKGDAAKWRPAEDFLERGEQILPILHKNNERLHQEIARRDSALAEVSARVRAGEEAIEALKAFHEDHVKTKVAAARQEVLDRLKAARKDEDIDAEAAALDELTQLGSGKTELDKPKGSATQVAPDMTKADWYVAWEHENSWYGKDARKTYLAMGIARDLLSAPETSNLRGRALLDRVSKEVNEMLAPGQRAGGASKVESGEGSGARGATNASATKSYRDLPADAKVVCDRQAKSLVGKGRAFKDNEAWQKYYVAKYFEG